MGGGAEVGDQKSEVSGGKVIMVCKVKSGKAGAVGRAAEQRLELWHVEQPVRASGATMKSPFPGMDPFIEARRLWGDFHDNLIVGLQQAIQDQLPEQYVARISERTFMETEDPDVELILRHRLMPDVEILRTTETGYLPTGVSAGVAISDRPFTEMHPQLEYEEREIYFDIFKLDPDKQLVTSVEILSPSNKRLGSAGWEQYARKRNIFIQGRANLVEIDLLRGGKRHPMKEAWPESPYVITVFRREKAPVAEVWAAFAVKPLPTIPIPLLPADGDLAVALQPVVSQIFARSRYYADMKYDQPIRPPLSADELLLLEAIKSKGR
jgi:hypothetical protein